jgi:hypothetical protein
MQRKIIYLFIIIPFLLLILVTYQKKSYAISGNYNNFSYMNVDSGRLLRDYDKKTINDETEKIKKRRFMGWNINKINDDVRATFITDLLFSYKNEGSTPITYKVNVASETTTKTSVSSTGSVGCKVEGGNKEFKAGLNNELKISDDYAKTELVKSQENLEIVVDPHTVVIGFVQGEGRYTNGTCSFYAFWIEQEIGWFEYFTITSSYLRIEKLSI